MTDEQIDSYVGLPYLEGGTTRDGFNCWGLLYHITTEYFNRDIPILPIGDEVACSSIFADMIRQGSWEQVNLPVDGDGVLLRGGTAPHVGVFLNGGVLHSIDPVGVIWTPFHMLPTLFGRTKYYRFHDERPSSISSRPV